MTELDNYLNLPYTITIKRDADGDFVATVSELPGCVAHGSSPVEAAEYVREIQRAWIEEALAAGVPVPIPEQETLPSGRWVQRVPRTMHQRLVKVAKDEGTSLNQLTTALLAEGLALRESRQRAPQSVTMKNLGLLPELTSHVAEAIWREYASSSWEFDFGNLQRSLEWAEVLEQVTPKQARAGVYEPTREKHALYTYVSQR
jgi:antitoxin HicB